jgi:ligand-binding sensor domain-containing protein
MRSMPPGSKSVRLGLALLLATALFPAVAAAGAEAGAWTTYLRARIYGDLVARHDTIWCASRDGGLLRYLPAADQFESIARQPDGLASQALTALEFDRSGRLWVGSVDRGVSRLSANGRRWDLISELDGLPGGEVHALRAVGDTMLIGTEHGVALWNGSEIVGAIPEGVNPSPFASDVISGVVLRGDSLWVSTAKGLYVSRASTGLVSWALADAAFANTALLALAWDGATLMTVAGGVPLVFDEAAGSWTSRGDIGTVLALSDDRGVIIACSNWGVYRWTGAGWSGIPGTSGIVATTTDETGRLWGASRVGLFEWTGAVWTLHQPDAPVGNNVQNIALQGSRVYIATNSEGVGRFDGTRWRNWFAGQYQGRFPWDTTNCFVTRCDTTFRNSAFAFALLVDRQGRKWVGNYGSAVESFDDDVSPPEFTHYTHSGHSVDVDRHMHTTAWAGACDSSGGRWFGMDSDREDLPIGIEYYDPAGDYLANYQPGNTPTMLSSLVRALLVDQPRGHLWAGYRGSGVTVFKLPATPGGPLELAAGGDLSAINTLDIFGIAAYRDSIWVMSSKDLRRFHAPTLLQVGAALPLDGSPAPLGACHPLDVGPDGTVWVGTDAGVHAYSQSGSVAEYTMLNSPLAGDVVRAIRVDPVSGVVWIGTATGLSRFDPAYVPPVPSELPTLEVCAYPNPAWLTGADLKLYLVGLGLRTDDTDTRYRGAVYDASGRKLHGFDDKKNRDVFWNGRDASGALVHPGVYFVRVEAGNHTRTLRVALLR